MTKVLVAEATGNVGSRVVQELRGRDVSVRTLGRWPVDWSHCMIRGVALTRGWRSLLASPR
jgi:uncharacterized protein YbjT (DUF2867 family)